MDLDSAIDWYGSSNFTAADVQRATGLSERSQRALLKLGILQAVPQSRTATRLLDSRMVKRASIVYPLHEHGGFNLRVSGKLVYADLWLESILFDVIDPWQARKRIADNAPGAEREWRWFTSNLAMEPNDYRITIINGRYVASGTGDALRIYGHLTESRTDIVVYRGAVWEELIKPTKPLGWSPNEFHPRSALVGKSRIFESKAVSESEMAAANEALLKPISKFSVNVSLTLRIAMRKLLRIDGTTI
jgi:hypothetical protein